MLRNLEQAEDVSTKAAEVLRPVLMTSLATILAFLPFTIVGPIPGTEMISPMATVIVGGLVTATLFNLFLLPVLYLRYGKARSSQNNPTQS